MKKLFGFNPDLEPVNGCQCCSFKEIAEDKIECTNCGATFTAKNK